MCSCGGLSIWEASQHARCPDWAQKCAVVPAVQAKVSFENEVRVMHLANTASYAELLETVRLKFPGAYPFQIKYLDRCGMPNCMAP